MRRQVSKAENMRASVENLTTEALMISGTLFPCCSIERLLIHWFARTVIYKGADGNGCEGAKKPPLAVGYKRG